MLDGMELDVRALDIDEWPVWRTLRLAALIDSPDAFEASYEYWAQADEERWRKRLAKPSLNAVATLDGEEVGMVTGSPIEERVELLSLWVAPEVRGQGVGDALVRTVVEYAGRRPVSLQLAESNTHARALYLRNGFVEVAPGVLVKVPA
ncbi:GNAT family N-acetyltransferase [Saccharothrix violaceirubra]|uniref:Ribosomal protein S18 acetylase RimI-like enzyme n=1 Tax=Saccharothrix violaceirubra TaxID=413306 RepID=A0A7W7SZE4_9PSEU|nr:GNAT family N-acetyltransferase [Saccharothrix violaceirubra]MBB4963670.1 ribosomal protein S18 acetylase RimI-like enzyme [Saccharothrix violaceirubra]